MKISTLAELQAQGENYEYLFWVGCAGSFDARAQRVTKAFATILTQAGISFGILGNEESCTGDPARRAGNEFLFQMLALQNIQAMDMYGVKKIITACPHCFNTLKNEYPALGGTYEVIHHTTFINELLYSGRISVEGGGFEGKKITYHDSCYLGRVNGIYEAPRSVLAAMDADLVEMKRCRTKGLCCGAGGAQMFKEDEPGNQRINEARMEDIEETGAEVVVSNCPFCLTMISDGIKSVEKQDEVMAYDLSELLIKKNNW